MKKHQSTLFFFFILGIFAGLFAKELKQFFDDTLRAIAPSLFNWQTRGQNTAELQESLQASGQRMGQKLVETQPYKRNYALLRHIIGIERWGQSRLKVALGEPFVFDEYDDYRPVMGLSWNELQDEFAQTREQTTILAQQIRENDSYHSYRILHNQLGELSVDGWLYYLRIHAETTLLQMS